MGPKKKQLEKQPSSEIISTGCPAQKKENIIGKSMRKTKRENLKMALKTVSKNFSYKKAAKQKQKTNYII